MQEEACESSPRRTPINDVLLLDGPKSETNVAHDERKQQPRLSGFPKFRGHHAPQTLQGIRLYLLVEEQL